MLRSLTGSAAIQPEKGDKRFRDPVWTSNPGYRALMQSYLAWSNSVTRLGGQPRRVPARQDARPARHRARHRRPCPDQRAADQPRGDEGDARAGRQEPRSRPAALHRRHDRQRRPAVDGRQVEVRRRRQPRGHPGQGGLRGGPPGTDPVLAAQPEVRSRPVFIVPPQINKFYIWDLAPGRSIVEDLVAQGHQVFIVSWRNPTEAESHWNLASYVEALDRATAVACEITGAPDLNLVGACSGGITAALLAALWGARGVTRAGSLSLFVAILDVSGAQETSMGLFASFETLELARMFSRSKGVLEGKDLERAFAWLRPNDLIWAYWVNNYLMGNAPSAFDILYWNADTTNLPAALHADMLRLIETGGITAERGPSIGGQALKLEDITCDVYLMGGETDHITPWDGCYLTSAGLGGTATFVLSQSGHIQSLINPPGNPKARFLTHDGAHATPEEFLAGAETRAGSWWPHWLAWLDARGGERVAAPKAVGSHGRRPLGDAPGTYVHAVA